MSMDTRAYRYVTVDVFTDTRFGGNPLAVLPDARGLDTAQMQAIAREFNYSETSFVLPAADPSHHGQVRIFTPYKEMPFAGHPNIGTAYVLARQLVADGKAVPDEFLFEEMAGLVPVAPRMTNAIPVGAALRAPLPLSRRGDPDPMAVAASLSLPLDALELRAHPPQLVSVGAEFLVVQLAGLEALARIRPDPAAWALALPAEPKTSTYAYVRLPDGALRSRMMTRALYEDPATGSATAAVAALLLDISGEARLEVTVRQGVEMGRPSLLQASAWREGGAVMAGVAGQCVPVMEGVLRL